MASELKVDKLLNASGDQDSGINLATNDTIKLDIAGSTKATMASTGIVSIIGEGTATTNLQQGLIKVWVHFEGDASGAAAVDSYNLTSMTDNGTGDYTITFNNDMNNVNYCFTTGVEQNTGQNTNNYGSKHNTSQTAGAITMSGGHEGGTLDYAEYCVMITGDLA